MNNIRKIRRQHNMTQEQLAEALGVTKQAICFNEKGRASRKTAEIYANYFQTSVIEILGLDVFECLPTTQEEKQYLLTLVNELEVIE